MIKIIDFFTTILHFSTWEFTKNILICNMNLKMYALIQTTKNLISFQRFL